MIYLFVLEIFLILIVFSLKLGIVYFLVKLFNRAVTFSKLFKVILLFEFGVLVFYFLISSFLPIGSFIPILIFPIVLGALFVLLMQKFSLLSWKKALGVLIVFFIVVTPFVSLLSQSAGDSISEIPVFKREISKVLPTNIFGWIQFSVREQPFPLQFVAYLEQSVSGDYYLTSIRQYLVAR